jgi:hypothetical protein
MTTNSEKKPEELDEEQPQKNNEKTGTPKTVDFSKVFKTTMAQMSSNIRKQPNKRTKREETLFEEEDSSEEEFSEEDEDSESESEEDIRWTAINKLLESHLKITETILTIVKETKNE